MIKRLFICLLIASSLAVRPAYAHHNSSLPEGVEPGWYGLEDSPHDEQIDFALSQRNGESEDIKMINQNGSATMESNQETSQSGDTNRRSTK